MASVLDEIKGRCERADWKSLPEDVDTLMKLARLWERFDTTSGAVSGSKLAVLGAVRAILHPVPPTPPAPEGPWKVAKVGGYHWQSVGPSPAPGNTWWNRQADCQREVDLLNLGWAAARKGES